MTPRDCDILCFYYGCRRPNQCPSAVRPARRRRRRLSRPPVYDHTLRIATAAAVMAISLFVIKLFAGF
jgi:hypothetical protein